MACCTVSGITVCFPSTQTLPDGTTQSNPFYDVINRRSFWTYTIQTASDPGAKGFEHWALQICSQLAAREDKNDFFIDFSNNNGASFKAVNGFKVTTFDNLTNLANCIRINESQQANSFFIYRITIRNSDFFNLQADPGTIVVRSQNNNFSFDPNSSCSGNALLTPSVNCVKVPVPPPPSPPPKVGGCEKIMVDKVVAEQIFSCSDTQTLNLGQQFSGSAQFDDITFTRIQVDCEPVFDNVNNQVDIDLTFTLDADVTIIDGSTTTDVTVSGITLVCSGTFCGVSADMFTVNDQALIECELVRVVSITHSDDDFMPLQGTLTTTITILSKFALLREEIVFVALCSGKNSTEVNIPAASCAGRCDLTEIIEELKEMIRQEIK